MKKDMGAMCPDRGVSPAIRERMRIATRAFKGACHGIVVKLLQADNGAHRPICGEFPAFISASVISEKTLNLVPDPDKRAI